MEETERHRRMRKAFEEKHPPYRWLKYNPTMDMYFKHDLVKSSEGEYNYNRKYQQWKEKRSSWEQ